MPSRRPKARPKRRRSHKPAHGRREAFIGFRCPGMVYEGRPRKVPSTSISAAGGGVGYDDGADWAEGEPSEGF